MLRVEDVARVAEAGGRLIVMPHGDVAIVREAKRLGLVCLPGVATPTEAFAALDAGADGLKMFPAELLSPAVLKAWRAVLPKETLVFPVGGIRPDNMAPYWAVGRQRLRYRVQSLSAGRSRSERAQGRRRSTRQPSPRSLRADERSLRST